MRSDKLILKFEDISLKDLPLVGGKGANLGELAGFGIPVPPGFVVTTVAYDRFLEENELTDFIHDRLKDIVADDLTAVRSASAEVKDKIKQGRLSRELNAAIANELRIAGLDNYYAVRSSATAEDLPGISFAGQHDSYLNIHREERIIERIKDCWASLFNDRAIIYRIKNSFDHHIVKPAVVVERMVASEKSGIIFTADPVSGKRTEAVINAGFGLGEALVGGLITPDVYRLDKKNLAIVGKNIGAKEFAIRSNTGEDGGTFREPLNDRQKKDQVLAEREITELAGLAVRIEGHYATPQDIEWAQEGGKIYIVQSRPITGLYPVPENAFVKRQPRLFLSFNYFQMMSDPISPLGGALIKMIFFHNRNFPKPDDSAVLTSAGGRLFVDPTDLFAFRFFRRLAPVFLSRFLDPIVGKELASAVARPEYRPVWDFALLGKSLRLVFFRIFPIIGKTFMNIFFFDPAKRKTGMIEAMERNWRENEHRLRQAADPNTKLLAVEQVIKGMAPVLLRSFIDRLAAGMLTFKLLEGKLERLGLGRESKELGRGLEGNVVMEMDLLIGDLADYLNKYPDLKSYLARHGDWQSGRDLSQLAGAAEFKPLLDNFFDNYGFRGRARSMSETGVTARNSRS